MASGVPHGSTVKPVLLKALIHHLDAGVKCTQSKFAEELLILRKETCLWGDLDEMIGLDSN